MAWKSTNGASVTTPAGDQEGVVAGISAAIRSELVLSILSGWPSRCMSSAWPGVFFFCMDHGEEGKVGKGSTHCMRLAYFQPSYCGGGGGCTQPQKLTKSLFRHAENV